MRRRPVARCRLSSALACAAAGLLLPAGEVRAQRVTGEVVQLGWGEPVGGALVVLLDGRLAQVDSVLTDAAGAFAFVNVAEGTYQLQASADGEFSTLSDPVRVARGAAVPEVLLVMPSALMMQAMACLQGGTVNGGGVLVGVAYEQATRSPLPGAQVRVEWRDTAGRRELATTTDERGRYRICGVPSGVRLRAQVAALGRTSGGETIEVEAGSLHRADLGLSAASLAEAAPVLEIVERRPTGQEHGRLTGRLIDEATGQPVTSAVVAVPEVGIETLTDGAGRFRLDLPAAVHMVELERLGYGEQSVSVEVAAGAEIVVEVRLTARPVALPGVSADARRPLLGLTDPKSSRIVTGADMAAYERRGASLESIVRERFPIRVQTGVYNLDSFTRRITCMESRRVTSFTRGSVQSDTILEFPECAMIPVFVDDAPVADPGTFVEHVRIEDFETIVYLAPTEVGLRYGLEGNSSGVLLLYTRGRGPFVDRARNVR